MKILVVDPLYDSREPIVRELEKKGHEVQTAIEDREAKKLFRRFRPDIVLIDKKIPNAIQLISLLSEISQVFFIGENFEWEEVRNALHGGAIDCIEKPFKNNELDKILTEKNLSDTNPHKALIDSTVQSQIIGEDPTFLEVLEIVNKVSDTDTTVLVTGESGTGKEIIARLIHEKSHRKRGPFIAINCGAIPDNLLESELFGHVKGAFTGAVESRPGVFGAAKGGTVFLDEIGEMSPNLQVKLLRVLQNFEYTPVGDYKPKKADVRIIAATNKDLKKSMEKGEFRLDLYYRLSVVTIQLPPLRTRQFDIIPLFNFFKNKYNQRTGRTLEGLSHKAESILLNYNWPGNIRELENLVERLVVLKGEGIVGEEDLPNYMKSNSFTGQEFPLQKINPKVNLKETLESIENKLIFEALLKTKGNRNKAAALLGLNRTTLVEKLKKKPTLLKELEKRLSEE